MALTATVASAVSAALLPPSQGLVQVDSTTQISLQRRLGAYIPLKINGIWSVGLIPASGPVLANTGLTAATKYYVYAFDNSGTVALETSTTGWVADSDTGVPIKSGDATRTLLAMVYMDAGTPGAFVDSTAKRYLLNWWNRRAKVAKGSFTTNYTSTSTTWTELNAEIRALFLTWADEAVDVSVVGLASASGVNNAVGSSIAFDSTSTPSSGTHQMTQVTVNGAVPVGLSHHGDGLSEGIHYATMLSAMSTGTGTWYGGAISGSTVVNRCALTATIRG